MGKRHDGFTFDRLTETIKNTIKADGTLMVPAGSAWIPLSESHRKSGEKPAAYWTSSDIPRRTDGAQKRTRTSTTLRSPAPEAGASTNSAIWARGRSGRLAAGRRACQPRRPAPRQILFQSRGFVALARPAPPFALAPSGASRHGDARDAAASGFENRQDRQG